MPTESFVAANALKHAEISAAALRERLDAKAEALRATPLGKRGLDAFSRAAASFSVEIDPDTLPERQWVRLGRRWQWAYDADQVVSAVVRLPLGKRMVISLPLRDLLKTQQRAAQAKTMLTSAPGWGAGSQR